MSTGLTTLDGFPRSDIDVPQSKEPASCYSVSLRVVADVLQSGPRARALYG
jgi:hypothetical protein